jgi:hypothetical protein
LLLENGADINAVGGSYGTALVAAVANGREAVAQLLIDHGVSKSDAGDWWRNMRIHKRKRHAELAKRFLDIDKFYFETFISLQNGLSVASDM